MEDLRAVAAGQLDIAGHDNGGVVVWMEDARVRHEFLVRGLPCGPVVGTTRQVYRNKLGRIIAAEHAECK